MTLSEEQIFSLRSLKQRFYHTKSIVEYGTENYFVTATTRLEALA